MRTAIPIAVIFAMLLPVGPAAAEVTTETIEYRDGETVLEGLIACDKDTQKRRPGVIVFHEWWGLNDYARMRAMQLAEMGYIVLAADIYGKGVRAEMPEQAAKLAGKFRKDTALMRSRVKAALEALRSDVRVDPSKIAAVGYCFGGTAALELARSGAKLKAVVSFHGGLSTSAPARRGKFKPRVLILHGGDDPHVSQSEVHAFKDEMRAARADWQVNSYGGAVHSFTNPDSGDDPTDGVAYHKEADRRSWKAMALLFADTIGLPMEKPSKAAKLGKFAKDKVAAPTGTAGRKAGEAVKRGALWVKDKVTGKD